MDADDNALLLPPENDQKREEKNIENNETHNGAQKIKKDETPLAENCSDVNTIYKLIYLMLALFVLYLFYFIYTLLSDPNYGAIDPLEQCVTKSLNEIYVIKDKIAAIDAELNCINTVAKYDISNFTNEYLAQKLANLTDASIILTKQIEEQKEIQFICSKQKLVKYCNERSLSKFVEKMKVSIDIYMSVFIILFIIALYYIQKAKKYALSADQKEELGTAVTVLKGFLVQHVIAILFWVLYVYLVPCSTEINAENAKFLKSDVSAKFEF